MRDPWPKAFDPELIASIQTIQDSLAGLSALYLAVIDPTGAPLTIPSNQAPLCADCHGRFTEAPCLPNFRQAIADAAAGRTTTQAQCPFGLMTYFSPIGIQGNPGRGTPPALLAIGRQPPAGADGPGSAGDGLAQAHADKTVTTFCRIFDLIFSLALHAGPHGAQALAPAAPAAGAAALSVREREVLHLVALGLSNRTIADRLFISEPTVKTHIHNISRKVKINNRTSLALFFLQSL